MTQVLEVINIERIPYSEALDLQHEIHNKCAQELHPGVLILLEHDPVITLGVKNTSAGNVLADRSLLDRLGVELIETDRGGDVTYHGPGQLVGYPIFRLRDLGVDLHEYLRLLEQVIINVLAEYGLEGHRNGPAGVWVGDVKVCSIGVAIRKKTTYHGFALNVNPNMKHFMLINPCGLESQQLSSIAALIGYVPEMDDIRRLCSREFATVFGFDY